MIGHAGSVEHAYHGLNRLLRTVGSEATSR